MTYRPGGAAISGTWPVGSTFICRLPTSPSVMLGFGTWEYQGSTYVVLGG